MYRFVVIGAMPTPSKKMKKNDPSYRRAGSKRYPVERRQTYAVSGGGTILIDVAKTLSAQNHRLYRQGKCYHVKLELLSHAPQNDALIKQQFTIKTIPDTWYVKKAWELAMATREEQLAESHRPRGRWDDFRIGWNSTYQTGTLGVAADMANLTADEAALSKVHDATDSADHGFVMFGAARDATNNLYGMIEQYDLTGNTMTNQPSSIGGTEAYANTKVDAGLVEAAGDLKELQGDNAPYDMDSFNGADDGGAVLQPEISTTEDGVGRTSLSFWAPLGLILVTNGSTGASAVSSSLSLTVSPGNYKGVKALDI
jgi:hypothetical protein